MLTHINVVGALWIGCSDANATSLEPKKEDNESTIHDDYAISADSILAK